MHFSPLRLLTIVLPLVAAGITASALEPEQEVQLFSLRDVRLLEGPFEHAQELNRRYLLAHDPDRFLAPFRREAGLDPAAEPYPNWENTGLDGHVGGHYLTALAQMAAATDDAEIRRRLDYMLAELRKCAEAGGDGYIGGIPDGRTLWDAIAEGRIEAELFALNGRWVPWYTSHKTFAGLRDAWLLTENDDARALLVGLADWCDRLCEHLDDAQLQEMLRSEHGGMNEVLADVYAITGDARYLRLARRFSDRAILEPLLRGEDQLDGLHANTQIPKVLGYGRIAELSNDRPWHDAARFFRDRVVEHRTVAIGGNSASEHFHPADDFGPMIESHEGVETCNTYNMLRLTEQLFRHQPVNRHSEFYERALFNHILSSQHPEHGGFVYFTPMRPGHYRVYSRAEQAFWCCVGSGMENHGRHGQFIYAHTDSALFVNLFIASEVQWHQQGLRVRQETDFPQQGSSRLVLATEAPTTLTLNIRRPRWADAEGFAISINGEPWAESTTPGTYVAIEREWQSGDVVEISLPLRPALERLPDGSDYAAILYGPVVLAAEAPGETPGLVADDGRWAHVAGGDKLPLSEAPVLIGTEREILAALQPVEGRPLTFRLAGVIQSAQGGGIRLRPFYTIHDSRYTLYWPWRAD